MHKMLAAQETNKQSMCSCIYSLFFSVGYCFINCIINLLNEIFLFISMLNMNLDGWFHEFKIMP